MVPKTQYQEQKKNYQKMMEDLIKKFDSKKTLLLHACCAPCSSYVIESLAKYFDITIYYYNPNIHPQQEYERRLQELKNFLANFPLAKNGQVKLIETEYNPEDYFKATNVREEIELQKEAEKGERCRRCYLFRMKKAWNYAVENDFDYFSTTLTISPFKDSEKVNIIGFNLEDTIKNLTEIKSHWLPSDFKKKSGFLRSLQLSDEYGLYRQDYCGCIYSKINH